MYNLSVVFKKKLGSMAPRPHSGEVYGAWPLLNPSALRLDSILPSTDLCVTRWLGCSAGCGLVTGPRPAVTATCPYLHPPSPRHAAWRRGGLRDARIYEL